MDRRRFIGTLIAAAVVTRIPAPSLDLGALKQQGVFGYLYPETITVDSMAEGFAMVQRNALAPTFMLWNPKDYQKINPEGYEELVRLQDEASYNA